jgi:hypothetical protein
MAKNGDFRRGGTRNYMRALLDPWMDIDESEAAWTHPCTGLQSCSVVRGRPLLNYSTTAGSARA